MIIHMWPLFFNRERVNEICGKYTPLHQAVLYLRKENIASLLEKGAGVYLHT